MATQLIFLGLDVRQIAPAARDGLNVPEAAAALLDLLKVAVHAGVRAAPARHDLTRGLDVDLKVLDQLVQTRAVEDRIADGLDL